MNGAAAQVDRAADRLHDQRGDQVAADGRQRLDAEEEHQHRGHQGAAAHAGQADDEPDDQARKRDEQINVHVL